MKPRVVYEVEVYDDDYDLVVCSFVRNFKDACRVVRKYPHLTSSIRVVDKREFLLFFLTDLLLEVINIKRFTVDPGTDRAYFKRTAAKIKAVNLPYVLFRGGFRF